MFGDEDGDGDNAVAAHGYGDDSEEDASSVHHTTHDSPVSPERQRKRRVRPRRKRKSTVVVPRLFKRDIRRYYATMLANVSNSHDHNLVASFFRTYAVEQLVLTRHRHAMDHSGAIGGALPSAQFHSRVFHDGEPHDLRGVPTLVRVLCGMFVMHPDQVFAADNVRIVSRVGDACSRVECDFRIAYNLLYDVHPVAFVDHIFEAVGIDDGATSDSSTDATPSTEASGAAGALMTLSTPPRRSPFHSDFDPFAYFHEKVGYAMPRRAEPLPISLQMQFVMHLDEARRMCRLEASMLRCETGAAAAAHV